MKNRYKTISSLIVDWFQSTKRALPWRINRTPYRVMVSEIMLQQTQVGRVIEYFDRWMQLFPTIDTLAHASLEEVMKAWEGLGYYSRARALKKASEYIVFELCGVFPNSYEELQKVPGIGPYTAGAILSFAFQRPTPAVDANVIRVLSRLFNIQEISTTQKAKHLFKTHVEALIEENSSSDLIEGLIELGAIACKAYNPLCREACPLSDVCSAFHDGHEKRLPLQVKKKNRERLTRIVFIVRSKSDGSYLVVKRIGKKIMSGLFEFPFFEQNEQSSLFDAMKSVFGSMICENMKPLPQVSHSFTRFQAILYPFLCELDDRCIFDSGEDESMWVSEIVLSTYPFSSGHKKIWKLIQKGFS